MFTYPVADTMLLERIRERICKTNVATLITIGPEGYPRARAMEDENVGPEFVFYFFTGASSRKIAEVKANPNVTIGYYEPGTRDYVCVFGSGEVVMDDDRRAAFWKDDWRRYWPAGPTDPEYAIVRVSAEAIEYFDMDLETLRNVTVPRSMASGEG